MLVHIIKEINEHMMNKKFIEIIFYIPCYTERMFVT